MTFERTMDYGLIKWIITRPEIWAHATDDFSTAAEEFEPAKSDMVWYVLVRDGDELLGMFMLVPENAICWKVHTCMLANAWGRKAKQAAKEGIDWVWKNMPAMRLVTDVPEYNRQASIFARWAGMTQFGLNPKSYRKNGKLMDVMLLGISHPEAK
jgi:RimJ/RimL family protein N-acetyltransferase